MTYIEPSKSALHSSHYAAIRDAIGERYRSLHDQTVIELPSGLCDLLVRLQKDAVTV